LSDGVKLQGVETEEDSLVTALALCARRMILNLVSWIAPSTVVLLFLTGGVGRVNGDDIGVQYVGACDSPGEAMAVAVSDHYAYIADGTSGLQVFDIATPSAPVRVGGCDTPGYAWDVAISGHYAYVADGTSGLQVIDITNPASPVLLGNYNVPGSNAVSVVVSYQYVYLAAQFQGLQVIDISSPTNPVLAGTYVHWDVTDVAVSRSRALLLSFGQLSILNVRVPSDIVLLGSIDASTHPYGNKLAVSGTIAVIGEGPGLNPIPCLGLQMIDCSTPTAPQSLSEVSTIQTDRGDEQFMAGGIVASGNHAYVGYTSWPPDGSSTHQGLVVFDISNPATPVQVGIGYVNQENPADVAQAGEYFYMACGNGGLVVLTATAPVPPVISAIPDTVVAAGAAYSGPTPNLLQGSRPITWSLVQGPEDMTIDASTGVVSWPTTDPAGSLQTVTIQATNSIGSDSTSWQLRVTSPPTIGDIADATIAAGQPYTGPAPVLPSTVFAVSWSLVAGPSGMTIDPSTGIVSWLAPGPLGSTEQITIRASNVAGSDTKSWQLTVLGKPVIADIADSTVNEGSAYTGPTPVLQDGSPPVTWSLVGGPAGMTIDTATGVVSWPNPLGAMSPYLVTIQASNSCGSDTEDWHLTVPISYTATVAADVALAPTGTPVALQGTACRLDSGQLAANVPVTIRIGVQGTRRVLSVTTDGAGTFATVFQPLPNEAGQYTVGADHPAVQTDTSQAQFVLVGMLTDPRQASERLVPGRPVTRQLSIRNLGDTALSGITASVMGAADNLNVQVSAPQHLAALETASFSYTVFATDDSVLQGTTQIVLTSLEGAAATTTVSTTVIPPVPRLAVHPDSLLAGMVRGSQRFVEFEVENTGGADTSIMMIQVPSAPWLSLVSPSVLDPLPAGGKTRVVLSLKPADDLPLTQYEGSLGISAQAASLAVPFVFTAMSEGKGDLEVIVEDEYTYYAEGKPHVADATVTVKDYWTGTAVAAGTTDAGGSLVLPGLNEGYYRIEVQAPSHSEARGTVFVTAGRRLSIKAFLPREAVHYSWSVTPTLIKDHYEITLVTTFETHVPMPVITVEPAILDMNLLADGSKQVDFTITNHGLVAAEEVTLTFDQHAHYEFVMPTGDLGVLAAQTSLVVPVLIRLKTPSSALASRQMAIENPICTPVTSLTTYWISCGSWKRTFEVTTTSRLPDFCYQGDERHDPHDPPWHQTGGGVIYEDRGGDGGGSEDVRYIPGDYSGPRYVPAEGDSPRVSVHPRSMPPAMPISCNGCAAGIAEAAAKWAFNYFVGKRLKCIYPILKTIYDVTVTCGSSSGYDASCQVAMIKDVPTVAISCGKAMPLIGEFWSGVKLGLDLTSAWSQYCGPSDSAVNLQMQKLEQETSLLRTLPDAAIELYGDEVWIGDGEYDANYIPWMDHFTASQTLESEDGYRISESERQALLIAPLPRNVTNEHVTTLVDRCNRTLDYWSAGIFKTEDVPPAQSTDFLDLDRLQSKWGAAENALQLMQQRGDEDVLDGFLRTLNGVQDVIATMPDGVCSRVKLELSQAAVIARNGFTATLGLSNSSSSNMEGVTVSIDIRDADGQPANDRFGITGPALTGILDMTGGGSVPPAATASAQWTILPSSEAASQHATRYTVGATLSYLMEGHQVMLPLLPDSIWVHPDPKLRLKYFWEYRVYGDDPFTPEVEPAIPFSVGLILTNAGAGMAREVTITSAQPKIIENELGLLIDFHIIGAQVGTQPVSPSLTAELGEVGPGKSAVARWLMTSALQGTFMDYSATFAHIDSLGDPRLSLMDRVDIHELIHAVRMDAPADDGIADFLVNDLEEIDHLPDRIYSSDGTEVPVSAVTQGSLSGSPGPGQSEVVLTATMPAGWTYLRVNNPGGTLYKLRKVLRADGSELRMDDNAWTTHRIVRPQAQAPYAEDFLHLVDRDSAGFYRLIYEDREPPTLVAAVSRRVHRDAGTFDIDLRAPLGDNDVAVECRQGGPTQVLLTFDRPISGSGGLDPSDVTLRTNGGLTGTVQQVAIEGNTLTVVLQGITEPAGVTLAFPGIVDASEASTEDLVCFGVLAGDVTGDGTISRVNVLDMTRIRNNTGASLTPANFRCDVNGDGRINTLDMTIVRNNVGKKGAACPPPAPGYR